MVDHVIANQFWALLLPMTLILCLLIHLPLMNFLNDLKMIKTQLSWWNYSSHTTKTYDSKSFHLCSLYKCGLHLSCIAEP